MGAKVEVEDKNLKEEEEEEEEVKRTCLAVFLCSFGLSVFGGLFLSWWNYKFHPTNRQLWMVPVGLILLLTPAIVWFSVFVSSACNDDRTAQSPKK